MSDPQDGMPNLIASFTHPLAIRRDSHRGVWFASALPAPDLDRLATAADPIAAGDEAVHRNREASVVFIAVANGSVAGITVWKGLMAMYEVFYAQLPDGGWCLTDHFRNAVTRIPSSERSPSDAALLAHYVSADVYDRLTYARGVDRLANGDRLDIDVLSGSVKIGNFSRHVSIATDEPIETHLARLDGAFEDALAPVQSLSNVAMGFSGGVDSTLLLSYLGQHVTPITILPGSPEFDLETDYAREALDLLGRPGEEIRLNEDDYLDRLVATVERHAMPMESYVTPVLSALFEGEWSTVVVGEGADSAFGSGRGIRRVASALSGTMGRATLRALGHLPGPVGRRADQIGDYADLFAAPPSSTAGYAARSLEYHGDNTLAFEAFGSEAVDGYFRDLLQGVTDRVELETDEDDGFFRHIEMTQWRFIFADLAMMGNHSAQANGKVEVQPYTSWRVLSEHLKVPARNRYVRGLSGKWMLKELLTRRLPEYKVNKRKLATGLPFGRYYERGPLTGFWNRYDIPDTFPKETHEALKAAPSASTWKAMTHAVYIDRVVNNLSLQPLPAALTAELALTVR